jgi:hypothetical protein
LPTGKWSSLGLFMTRVLAATATELAEFQAVGRGLLILGRHVVPTLAILTLKHNVIAWHLFNSWSLVFGPGPLSFPGSFKTQPKNLSPAFIPQHPKPCRLPPCDHLHE